MAVARVAESGTPLPAQERLAMLTLSADALALFAERNQPILIDVPQTIEACCLEITACPSVRFGRPRDPGRHTLRQIQGPRSSFPNVSPSRPIFRFAREKFLGRTYLYISGWRLV